MVIEFAIDHYDRLLSPCEPSSHEYEILKNGLVVRRAKNGKYERVVEIFAEMRDAQLLLPLPIRSVPPLRRLSQKRCPWRAVCSVNLPFKPSSMINPWGVYWDAP
jgi:hypothetical protein